MAFDLSETDIAKIRARVVKENPIRDGKAKQMLSRIAQKIDEEIRKTKEIGETKDYEKFIKAGKYI